MDNVFNSQYSSDYRTISIFGIHYNSKTLSIINYTIIHSTVMIFFIAINSTCPVHLLGKYQSYQLVRKNQLG